jgi:hypothetical protein
LFKQFSNTWQIPCPTKVSRKTVRGMSQQACISPWCHQCSDNLLVATDAWHLLAFVIDHLWRNLKQCTLLATDLYVTKMTYRVIRSTQLPYPFFPVVLFSHHFVDIVVKITYLVIRKCSYNNKKKVGLEQWRQKGHLCQCHLQSWILDTPRDISRTMSRRHFSHSPTLSTLVDNAGRFCFLVILPSSACWASRNL